MLEYLQQPGVKPRAMLALGTVIGIVLGAGSFFFLGKRLGDPPTARSSSRRHHSNRRPSQQPDWKEMARSITIPSRRDYALPLNNPDMVPTDQATHMLDDDVVIGVLYHGQARAYPWWSTSNYHVVNDTVGDAPLLVTLCEVCGGATAYCPTLPELPETPLSFQLCSVDHATIEIADHQTLSKWHPFLGTAFEGPLKGRSLERLPVLVMTWREWKQLYPGGLVANGSPQLRERPHGAIAGKIGDADLPGIFAATANLTDDRLGLHELVLGIAIPKSDKSYAVPVSELVPFPNLFLVTLEAKPVLIVRQGELAVTALDLEWQPASYRTGLSLVSKSPIQFRSPDGFIWNAVGVNTSIESHEVRIPSAKSYLTEWYEWVSHSPRTEIVHSAEVITQTGSGTE